MVGQTEHALVRLVQDVSPHVLQVVPGVRRVQLLRLYENKQTNFISVLIT